MTDVGNEIGIIFQETLRLVIKNLDVETECPFLGALRREMRKLMNEGEVDIASTDEPEDGTGCLLRKGENKKTPRRRVKKK